jgi:hypothetical protein
MDGVSVPLTFTPPGSKADWPTDFRNLAKDLPQVDLADAIRLTCLAAEKDTPDRFDAMAVRVIARLIEERRLSLNDVIWAAQRLQDAGEGVDGETALLNLVRQKPLRH